MENPTTIVKKMESYSILIGHFNTSPGSVLADKRVRLAINLGVNREEFIHYDLFGNGNNLAGLALPGMVGYDPSLAPYQFDPVKAAKLLEEAGVGESLRLKVIAIPQASRAANILKSQLERIGIHLDVTVIPNTEVIEAFQKQRYDIGLTSLPNPLAHMFFPLSICFYSRSPFSLMHDADFDGRLEGAVSTTNPQLQEQKFKELNRYVYDQALAIPIYQRIKTYGATRRVFFTPYVTGMPYFSNAMSGVVNSRKTAE
jgi:peptide/nickel transport system substrate-binding protein